MLFRSSLVYPRSCVSRDHQHPSVPSSRVASPPRVPYGRSLRPDPWRPKQLAVVRGFFKSPPVRRSACRRDQSTLDTIRTVLRVSLRCEVAQNAVREAFLSERWHPKHRVEHGDASRTRLSIHRHPIILVALGMSSRTHIVSPRMVTSPRPGCRMWGVPATRTPGVRSDGCCTGPFQALSLIQGTGDRTTSGPRALTENVTLRPARRSLFLSE